MEQNEKNILSQVDLVFLKQKGLTDRKIAELLHVSVASVEAYMNCYQAMISRSGVF